jgi:hypothetical protein
MKPCAVFAVPAVIAGLVLLPVGAGASPSPVALVPTVDRPTEALVETPAPAPAPDPAFAPAVAGPAAPVIAEIPVPAAVPPAPVAAVIPAAGHDAEMHAMLCAARPVFCEVDQSGRYIVR